MNALSQLQMVRVQISIKHALIETAGARSATLSPAQCRRFGLCGHTAAASPVLLEHLSAGLTTPVLCCVMLYRMHATFWSRQVAPHHVA